MKFSLFPITYYTLLEHTMASNLGADRLIYFTAGVSLVFMMYSVVRHATALFDSEPQESRNILGMVEDST